MLPLLLDRLRSELLSGLRLLESSLGPRFCSARFLWAFCDGFNLWSCFLDWLRCVVLADEILAFKREDFIVTELRVVVAVVVPVLFGDLL